MIPNALDIFNVTKIEVVIIEKSKISSKKNKKQKN